MAQRVRPPPPPFYPATHPTSAGAMGKSLYDNIQPTMNRDRHTSPIMNNQQQDRPSSNGLIRITLRKPMGIVFEPMPQQPGAKGTGVRVCDLPRTGAAAMSRKLEIGDELLSINGVTMSRLSFDEIMDFIIAADPDGLHLLFRRKGKDVIPSASASLSFQNAVTSSQQATVKWAEQESEVYEKSAKSSEKQISKVKEDHRHLQSNHSKSSSREEEDSEDDETNTYQSEEPSIIEDKKTSKKKEKQRAMERPAARTSSTSNKPAANSSSSKHHLPPKQSAKKTKKEELGFLDMLIDSLCQVTSGGKMAGRKDDDSVYTVDDFSDEGTYQTNDDPSLVSEEYRRASKTKTHKDNKKQPKDNSKNQRGRSSRRSRDEEDSVDEEQTLDEEETVDEGATVEDDYTLETTDTNERPVKSKKKSAIVEDVTSEYSEDNDASIGWAPLTRNESKGSYSKGSTNKSRFIESKPSREPAPPSSKKNTFEPTLENRQSTSFDLNIQLPFRELEYNYDADEGDVSVLTNNMSQYGSHISPQALVYVHSYVPEPGKSLQESIENNPERFYRHAVKEILSQNEPEKVRLLDKLLSKYQGREEHLIQKLTLRYRAAKQQGEDQESKWGKTETIPEEGDEINQSPRKEAREEPPSSAKNSSAMMNYESLGSFGTMEDVKSPLSFLSSIEQVEQENAISPIKENSPDKLVPHEQQTSPRLKSHPSKELKIQTKSFDSPPPAPPARKPTSDLMLSTSYSSEKPESKKEVLNAPALAISAVIPKNSPQDGFSKVPSPPRMNMSSENKKPVETFHMDSDYSEDEGESEYTSEDYSDSQIDGTSPAVIAQVSELLNFVYGKTSVPGQIDRVSTIMRAYEGRENVLLELLETKALIKANQMNEHPPAGLISGNSGSHATQDEAYDEYDDHPDDISSVSGDNSTKFNVKVPSASESGSPMVSPMTAANTVETPFRDASPRKINGKENKGVSHPNYGNSSLASLNADKKKKGIFGGLFKGKKGKKKGEENYYQSPPTHSKYALHMMAESEQEI